MRKILSIILVVGIIFPNLVSAQTETLSSYFGGKLPSISERKGMARECGIENYVGSFSQNVSLLSCLKSQDKNLKDNFFGNDLPTIYNEDILGAGYNPVTGYQSRTTGFISTSATTIPVVSTKTPDGNQISLSDISASGTVKVYLNLAPGSSKEEPVICTGLTVTSWTGCTRGIAFSGSSETASSTLAKNHNAGTPIIITNIGQFFNQYVAVDGTQQINGVKTFVSSPLVPTPGAGDSLAAVNVTYANALSFAGAPTSTETNLGQVELATQTEISNSTASSSAGGPLVIPSKWATSTPTVTGKYITMTETDGKLNQSFLDLTESYTWTGAHTYNTNIITNNAGAITTASSTFTATTTFAGDVVGISNLSNTVMSTGEAIDGSSTPVPVAVATTTATYLKADANDITRVNFVGFITSNASSGSKPQVQTQGVVSGFTGLTAGATYYISDTVGTIQTTHGTTIIPIGVALSSSKLLIQKGKKIAVSTITDYSASAGGSQNRDIQVGFQPNEIKTVFRITGVVDGTGLPFYGTALWKGTTLVGAMGMGRNQAATAVTGQNIHNYSVEQAARSLTVDGGTDGSKGTLSISSVNSTGLVMTLSNTIDRGAGQTISASTYSLISE